MLQCNVQEFERDVWSLEVAAYGGHAGAHTKAANKGNVICCLKLLSVLFCLVSHLCRIPELFSNYYAEIGAGFWHRAIGAIWKRSHHRGLLIFDSLSRICYCWNSVLTLNSLWQVCQHAVPMCFAYGTGNGICWDFIYYLVWQLLFNYYQNFSTCNFQIF